MDSQEIKGLHYSHSSVQNLLNLSPNNHILSPADYSQNTECSANFFYRSLSSHSSIRLPLHIFSPNTTSALSIDSTLNEMSENQQGISHERRIKRMISNRESARRSRMRKKKQIEELQCQVNHLQAINHQLSEKLINLLESNHQILQENSQLKERISSLQVVMSDLLTPRRNVEDNFGSTNHLQGEPSN